MNNETKLLAMSMLAILEDIETSHRFSLKNDLELIKEFNTEEIIEQIEDTDWELIEEKTTKIKDKALDKIISKQREEIAQYYNNEREKIEKKFSHNKKKIDIIKNILGQVLEKEIKKEEF